MTDNIRMKVLYITYLGILESIPNSQVLPYLFGLCKDAKIYLLSFEKKGVVKANLNAFKRMKDMFAEKKIMWYNLTYHKHPLVLSSFFDIFIGTVVSLYLVLRHRILILHARSNIPIVIGFILRLFNLVKLLYDRRGIVGEDHVEHSGWREGGCLYRLAIWFERRAIRRSDAIIVLTERMNKHLRKTLSLGNNALIKTIPCCIDLTRFYREDAVFDLKSKLGLRDKFVFIYSGSLGTYNLVEEMFDFFRVALGLVPNAHFLILTQNKDVVFDLISRRKDVRKEAVSVLSVSPQEVPRFLSVADAGLVFRRNSSTAIAASPTKFGEYLACGIPVVSMLGIGDIEEMIRRYGAGVVLDRYEASEYRQAIEKLLVLSKEKTDLRKRCRNLCKDYFSLDRGINIYRKVYNCLLERK